MHIKEKSLPTPHVASGHASTGSKQQGSFAVDALVLTEASLVSKSASRLKPGQALIVELDYKISMPMRWHIDGPFGEPVGHVAKLVQPPHSGTRPPLGSTIGTQSYRWEPEQVAKAINSGKSVRLVATLKNDQFQTKQICFDVELETSKTP